MKSTDTVYTYIDKSGYNIYISFEMQDQKALEDFNDIYP